MYKAIGKTLVAVAALSGTLAMAQAKQSTQADAINHVKKAIARIKEIGAEKAFAEFNTLDNKFNVASDVNPNGDLYALVYLKDGVQPVHGKNPKIPGKNVLEMKDRNGTPLIKEMIAACWSAEGKGWVNYVWPHSITQALEEKQTYVERAGDYCVGAGIYKAKK